MLRAFSAVAPPGVQPSLRKTPISAQRNSFFGGEERGSNEGISRPIVFPLWESVPKFSSAWFSDPRHQTGIT